MQRQLDTSKTTNRGWNYSNLSAESFPLFGRAEHRMIKHDKEKVIVDIT